MKKVLVTGAVGQIGRFLTRKLTEEKIDFCGLDIRPAENSSGFELLNLQITNKDDLERNKTILKDFDTLVHLASKIDIEPDVIKSGPPSIDLNIVGTLNLLEYLPNVKHVCYTSTYMVYGKPKIIPVNEDHTTDPANVYGASKLATEKFLQIFAEQRNTDVTILRIMGIYGLEKPYTQAIPSFIKLIANNESPVIYGTGNNRRNHIYIDDVVDAILTTLRNPKNGVFNIGGTDNPSNLDLIKMVNEKLRKSIKPIFKDIRDPQHDFITDISKAQKVLGFEPKIGIEKGLDMTIHRYLTKGW